MPKPAKSPEEIEDLLASIRNLVSDNAPAPESPALPSMMARRAEAAEGAGTPTKNTRDEALVLSPLFRIEDDEETGLGDAPAAEGGTDTGSAPARTPSFFNDAEIDAEVANEAPMAVMVEEEGRDIGDVAELFATPSKDDQTSEEALVKALSNGTDAPTVLRQDSDTNAAADPTTWSMDDRLASFDTVGPDLDDTSGSSTDLDDLRALDGVVPDQVYDFEAETGDQDWPNTGADLAALNLAASRDVEVGDPTGISAEDHVQGNALGGPSPDALGTSQAADAGVHATPEDAQSALESAFFPSDDTGEVDGEADENALDELADTAFNASVTFGEVDTAILDEDTLREIIVDVVREELQGQLGHRITRNVRKMVRREIHQAFAAKDLDGS